MSDNENLNNALNSIFNRLSGTEDKLTKVVRLEEKVSNHTEELSRQIKKLDSQDERLRVVEMWQASRTDQSALEKRIEGLAEDNSLLWSKVDDLQSKGDVISGSNATRGSIIKWGGSLTIAAIVSLITFIASGKSL